MATVRNTFSAGAWQIVLTQPWPIWVTLRRGGVKAFDERFSHEELRDLHYVLGRAIESARVLLGPTDEHQV